MRFTALVIHVEGQAQARANQQEPWRPIRLDDKLDVGSEIRTGLRGVVGLRAGINATILIDRLTVFRLVELSQDQQTLVSRTAILRGRVDVKVDDRGMVNDFQAATPSAVLSVRGTGLSLAWGALHGTTIYGVRGNRIRAMEVEYWQSGGKYYLSGNATSSEDQPNPVLWALSETAQYTLTNNQGGASNLRNMQRIQQSQPQVDLAELPPQPVPSTPKTPAPPPNLRPGIGTRNRH